MHTALKADERNRQEITHGGRNYKTGRRKVDLFKRLGGIDRMWFTKFNAVI